MVIFRIKLTIIYLLISIVFGKDLRSFLVRNYSLVQSSTDRPERPFFRHGGLPSEIGLHHVVPYRTLKGFYNAVLRRAIPGELRHLGVALKNVLSGVRRAKNFARGIDQEALAGVTISSNAFAFCGMLADLKDTTDPSAWGESKAAKLRAGYEETIRYYVWLAGNLFVGPATRMRADDPGDAFEAHSCPLVGPAQFALLHSLASLMDEFVQDGGVKTVAEVADKLDSVVKHDPIIFRYDEKRWARSARPPYTYSIQPDRANRRCA